MKKYIVPIILGCIAFVMILITFGVSSSRDNSLAEQTEKINSLSNQIEMLQSANKSNEDALIQKNSGVSALRKENDEDIINAFMRELFTWSNMSEYEEARQKIIKQYNLSENSDFVKVFLAPVDDENLKDLYNKDGYNATYNGAKTYVTKISTDKYSYLSIIDVSMKKLKYSADSQLVFTCDIDKEGNISNLGAFPIAVMG